MFKNLRSSLLVALVSAGLLVSGCGFHLRGKVIVHDSLKTLHVAGDEQDIITRVIDGLEFSDIVVVDTNKDVAVLDLSNIEYERSVNTTDDAGNATAYKLEYTVKYQVLNKAGELLQKETLEESRTFSFNASQILLSEREEDFLKEDMQKELTNRLLRRLTKINPDKKPASEAAPKP